jgi:hypothetical protein
LRLSQINVGAKKRGETRRKGGECGDWEVEVISFVRLRDGKRDGNVVVAARLVDSGSRGCLGFLSSFWPEVIHASRRHSEQNMG